ncbi:MAG: transcription antitermination factor NusB [Ruminococcaceae bacterium]|nr:transcription antitermination factor NusB [Oscillospiraceae bacterium]
MTRNTAREIATHLAYELSFTELSVKDFLDARLSEESFSALAEEYELYETTPNQKQDQYIRRLVAGVADHAAELDTYIEKYAKGWRFERISLVASAIMRVAMFEILYMPDVPNGVAINEAVEIAKKYETPEVARFMNGILGSFVREEVKE